MDRFGEFSLLNLEPNIKEDSFVCLGFKKFCFNTEAIWSFWDSIIIRDGSLFVFGEGRITYSDDEQVFSWMVFIWLWDSSTCEEFEEFSCKFSIIYEEL